MTDENPFQWSPDTDNDGAANDCDNDDDNDLVLDVDDLDPLNPFSCIDLDLDDCDDCSSGTYNELDDGFDYDGDGMCDIGDGDDDNDGAMDEDDSDDNDPNVCSDTDGDDCDDCSTGEFNTSDDGFDYDEDGLCDLGDNDDDNDGAMDEDDSDDNIQMYVQIRMVMTVMIVHQVSSILQTMDLIMMKMDYVT